MSFIPYTRQALIGYRNVFAAEGATVTGDDDSGGPALNAFDGLTHDFWTSAEVDPQVEVSLPEPQSADYVAIALHNLGDLGASLIVESSEDGVTWAERYASPAIATNDPALFTFDDSGAHSYWRVRVDGGYGLRIGILHLGAVLTLSEGIYEGHAPPKLNRSSKILNNEAEGGQYLGRSVIRTGVSNSIKQSLVPPEWVRTEWYAFQEYARAGSFFFAWRHTEYPGDVMFGWSEDEPTAEQGRGRFMSVSLNVKGIG